MKTTVVLFTLSASVFLPAQKVQAAEGGIETYLLGSRDSMSGILPPPGTYLNNDFVYFSGTAPSMASGGVVVTDPDVEVFTYKFNFTHVFDAQWGNTRLGLNFNLPYVSANGQYSGDLSSGFSGTLNDDGEHAFGDIVLSPLFNWSKGKLHTTLALQFFLPTGHYQTTQINVANRSIDALNAGKNRFAFDPTLSMTWFDPTTGWEYSGSFGVTFSAENDATDYQTAPEAHFEGTVMRHLPNKLALGVTGYAYHQIGDDSGSGADGIKQLLGADSLEASVYGLGPIVTWSTQVGQTPISIKAKYIKEFGAKRRFESDKVWMTVGLVF
ncbi:SphA family protein [Ruegeria atlantica]|uniref:SphA family protein n=1 Tax=Ruegeria atlantica TaxID=81569 RepID=UPI0024945361|nr:transporter [Ruegeria atlantica]